MLFLRPGNIGELVLQGTVALGRSVPEYFCPYFHCQSVPQNFSSASYSFVFCLRFFLL